MQCYINPRFPQLQKASINTQVYESPRVRTQKSVLMTITSGEAAYAPRCTKTPHFTAACLIKQSNNSVIELLSIVFEVLCLFKLTDINLMRYNFHFTLSSSVFFRPPRVHTKNRQRFVLKQPIPIRMCIDKCTFYLYK